MTAAEDDLLVEHGALRRGGRPVLGAGRLRAPAGSVVALVGENGAGKSTLLMAAADVLLPPRAARVTLGGHRVRALAWLPQRPALPPWLAVRQAAALHGARAAWLEEAAARLGMMPLLDRRADELSGGQLQALAVAIALARPEPVLLLDEPFTAVDLARRPVLRALVAERAARVPEGVVVLSSHAAADLAALCDWVVVLRDGGYAWQGAARALALRGAPGPAGHPHGDGANGDGANGDGAGDGPAIVARLDAAELERAVTALLAPGGHSPL